MTQPYLEGELKEIHAASFGWALACCGWNRDEAEDVLQTAYLKILEGRASFDGRSRFQTWLFGVIRHTAWERRRSTSRRLRLLALWWSGQPTPDVHTENWLREDVRDQCRTRLRDELAKLPNRQREVLHLVFYQDLTIEDAAAIMGVSVGSARVHYHRGKTRMAALLGGDRS